MYLIAVCGRGERPRDLDLRPTLLVDAGRRPTDELDDIAAALRWHAQEIETLRGTRAELERECERLAHELARARATAPDPDASADVPSARSADASARGVLGRLRRRLRSR